MYLLTAQYKFVLCTIQYSLWLILDKQLCIRLFFKPGIYQTNYIQCKFTEIQFAYIDFIYIYNILYYRGVTQNFPWLYMYIPLTVIQLQLIMQQLQICSNCYFVHGCSFLLINSQMGAMYKKCSVATVLTCSYTCIGSY